MSKMQLTTEDLQVLKELVEQGLIKITHYTEGDIKCSEEQLEYWNSQYDIYSEIYDKLV